MFYGEYQHSIDAKGRVIIPSKFRDELGQKFILTKGLDNCLFAYSSEEWYNLETSLDPPFTDRDVRAFARFSLQEPRNANWTSKEGYLYPKFKGICTAR